MNWQAKHMLIAFGTILLATCIGFLIAAIWIPTKPAAMVAVVASGLSAVGNLWLITHD